MLFRSGFQLWVNLPARLKMSEPDYQEFGAEKIPVETREDGVTVKVITGATARGAEGPVKDAAISLLYFDVDVPAGAAFEEPLAPDLAAMIAVYEGSVRVEGVSVDALGAAFLGAGDTVRIEATKDARFLLIAGRPIREPVARSEEHTSELQSH